MIHWATSNLKREGHTCVHVMGSSTYWHNGQRNIEASLLIAPLFGVEYEWEAKLNK